MTLSLSYANTVLWCSRCKIHRFVAAPEKDICVWSILHSDCGERGKVRWWIQAGWFEFGETGDLKNCNTEKKMSAKRDRTGAVFKFGKKYMNVYINATTVAWGRSSDLIWLRKGDYSQEEKDCGELGDREEASRTMNLTTGRKNMTTGRENILGGRGGCLFCGYLYIIIHTENSYMYLS